MKIVSLNIGKLQKKEYKSKILETGIFKKAVDEVYAANDCLAGDQIGDTEHHGGKYKAVYGYSASYYPYWKNTLDLPDLPFPSFGENLTLESLDEKMVHIGDLFQVGDAVLMAREPRHPCQRLCMRFNREDMIKLFLDSGKTGVYFSIEKEGIIRKTDEFKLMERATGNPFIDDVTRVFFYDKDDLETAKRLVNTDLLREKWRKRFHNLLEKSS